MCSEKAALPQRLKAHQHLVFCTAKPKTWPQQPATWYTAPSSYSAYCSNLGTDLRGAEQSTVALVNPLRTHSVIASRTSRGQLVRES